MRTLYFECNMGAAGDMLMSALYDLLPETDKQDFLNKMNSLGLGNVKLSCKTVQKCGIYGSHISVLVDGQEEHSEDMDLEHIESHHHHHEHTHNNEHTHHHYTYRDICDVIEKLDLPEKVKADATSVYKLIGEAESFVHNMSIGQIHFHEVGSLDAVADVVGCCLLINKLDVSSILASPIHVGSGFVHCAHGVLPVPAPATAHILMGVPTYSGNIKGELCTPTGAAVLKHFVQKFGSMPVMTTEKIGYGMGNKDFEIANCVRVFLSSESEGHDEIAELSCNLDDMTPEAIGFAIDILMEEKALDVFATPIVMKKSRPAYMLTCLCRPEDQERMTKLLLKHTTTLGVRFKICNRNILSYKVRTAETKYGSIRIKCGYGYGVNKEKAEYEDVKQAATTYSLSIADVLNEIK